MLQGTIIDSIRCGMGRLMKKLLFSGLALVVLAGCSPFVNLADNGRYRVLGIWPLLCHDDGSVILLQKANTRP